MAVSLPDFIDGFLSARGGVVAPSVDGGAEYIIPTTLAEALGIGEFGRIVFSREVAGVGTVLVSHDSELTRAMRALLAQGGAICSAAFPSATINPEKFVSRVLADNAISNATLRMVSRVGCDVSFDLVVYRYVAVSDDRQEGLVAVLVDSLNGRALIVPREEFAVLISALLTPTGPRVIYDTTIEKSLQVAYPVALKATQRQIGDFLCSLEKRLKRDVHRIGDYYAQLSTETEKALARVLSLGEAKQEQVARLRAKEKAIITEKAWKIKDAISKYSVTLSAEPLFLVHITSPGAVFRLEILRKTQARPLILTFNPILKKMEAIACEACDDPCGVLSVCDERMHIVCAGCFSVCLGCAKKFCHACFPQGCPRCSKEILLSKRDG